MRQTPLEYRSLDNTGQRKGKWLGLVSCALVIPATIFSLSNLRPPTSMELESVFWPTIAFISLGGFGTGIALAVGGYFRDHNRIWAIVGLIANSIGFLKAGWYIYGMYWYGHNNGWL